MRSVFILILLLSVACQKNSATKNALVSGENFSLQSSEQTMEGHENGNGGGGFMCHDSHGFPYVIFADVWEGRNVWGLDIPETPIGTFSDLKLAELTAVQKTKDLSNYLMFDGGDQLQSLAQTLYSEAILFSQVFSKLYYSSYFAKDLNTIEFNGDYDATSYLEFPDDAFFEDFPKQCTPVGVLMFYDDEYRLFVNPETYLLMRSSEDVVASLLHESFYLTLRTHFKFEDSNFTRKLVSCVLSRQMCEHISPEDLRFLSSADTTWIPNTSSAELQYNYSF